MCDLIVSTQLIDHSQSIIIILPSGIIVSRIVGGEVCSPPTIRMAREASGIIAASIL